ncbi:MAG: hypothetical protein R3D00_01430 [Bacteroidia bacterium]
MRHIQAITFMIISLVMFACTGENQRFINKIHKQLEGNWQITEIQIMLSDNRDSVITNDLGTLRFPHCEDYQAADCIIERVFPDGKKIEGIYFAFSDEPEGNGRSLNLSLFTGIDNSAEQWVGPFTIVTLDKDILHISTQGPTALANNGMEMEIYASRTE